MSRKTVCLTPAETRVLTLLTTYQTLAGIGSELGIARPTVKTHVQNIYKKLGATKRAEAVKLAESAGLLPDRAALMTGEDPGMALSQPRARNVPRERGGQVETEQDAVELDRSSVQTGRGRG
jgi:DNA-binding CsgD family transcriptional regulator